MAQRLCGWLQVDITNTRILLDCTPPVDTQLAFQRTVTGFRTPQDNSR